MAKSPTSFKKGHKPTKPKGSVNKVTQTARELFVKTLEGQVPALEQAFKDVLNGQKDESGKWTQLPDSAKYLELMAKYAQYFVPKQLDVSLGQQSFVIEIIKKSKK